LIEGFKNQVERERSGSGR